MANSFPSSHSCPSSLTTNVRDCLAHTSADTDRLSVCMLLLTKRCGLLLYSDWILTFLSVLKAILSAEQYRELQEAILTIP